MQYLMNQVPPDLTVVKEIDFLEEQLLRVLNQGGGGHGDPKLSLSLRRPSTLTPTEYWTLLAEYDCRCRQESFSRTCADVGTTAPRHCSHEIITIVKRYVYTKLFHIACGIPMITEHSVLKNKRNSLKNLVLWSAIYLLVVAHSGTDITSHQDIN